MDDKELLELAAKAEGRTLGIWQGDSFEAPFCGDWNPLTDDGDALRLAVKLYARGFMLEAGSGGITVTVSHPVTMADEWCPSSGAFDPAAATRRAIVRAAAKIGNGIVTPNDQGNGPRQAQLAEGPR